jgi:hypothetical protein
MRHASVPECDAARRGAFPLAEWLLPTNQAVVDVIRINAAQMAVMTRESFFGRVSAFILEQSAHPAYRATAADAALRRSLWLAEWPRLAMLPEREAAMFLCFLLACVALGLDVERGAAMARGAPDPVHSLQTFLSERGLIEASAFDAFAPARPGAA